MNEKILLENGYRKYNQEEEEKKLYQKKINDKKGIKYFINCYHYIFLEHETWDFELQITSKQGGINTLLFHTELNINDIEMFMKKIWEYYGSNYYELFVISEENDA